jgi:hypothetical protein
LNKKKIIGALGPWGPIFYLGGLMVLGPI